MNLEPADKNRRVLVIDDNRAIHDDFRKILSPADDTADALDVTEEAVFGLRAAAGQQTRFEVDSAYQGQEGAQMVKKALAAGRPYAMAFVDVRMPPGWDGVETTRKIWKVDPDLQVVLCTAYSDYSWGEMFEKLGGHDGLLILKKPFDSVEAFQLAHALTEKWWLHQQFRRRMEEMENRVAERTHELQQTNHALQREVVQHERAQAELEKAHKLLLEASRRGGMAEIATNVLHNVGNVLNSVNVSTSLIVDRVKKSRVASLGRVVVLLQEQAEDLGAFITLDPRGKHLPVHLAQLSEHLMAEQGVIVSELDLLRKNVEHIKEIVAMQQNYATSAGVKEMINVASLVEDSLRMHEAGLNRHGVKVIRELEDVPLMNVEKHKILQILVNLLRNAKHACQESPRADKRLTVRVVNGDGRIKISVIDNGVGIPAENLTRIFNYGFTTRKDGHGFGLHSGALAAKEMGGSLTVQSDGPGQGAAFILELPCPTQEKSHES